MAKQLIDGNSALSFLMGKGSEKAELFIKEFGVLPCITGINIAYLTSKSPYSGTLHAGNMIWNKTHLPTLKTYDIGQQITNTIVNDKISNKEIEYISGGHMIETFDQALNSANAPALLTNMVNGYALKIQAYHDVNFFQKAADYVDLHPEQTIYIPKIGSLDILTEDESKVMLVKIAAFKSRIHKTFTLDKFGINAADLQTILDTNCALMLSQSVMSNTKNIVDIQTMKNYVMNTGINNYVPNPANVVGFGIAYSSFLNNTDINDLIVKNEQGAPIQKTFHIRYQGFMMYRGAIAYPILPPEFKSIINPNNQNPIFTVKFATTHAYLYPELIYGIIDSFQAGILNSEGTAKETTDSEIVTYKINKNEEYKLQSNVVLDSEISQVTYTKSGTDSGNVTITNNKKIKATDTVGANGCTITAKFGSSDSAPTFQFKVKTA